MTKKVYKSWNIKSTTLKRGEKKKKENFSLSEVRNENKVHARNLLNIYEELILYNVVI